jgi:hypothetical protein
MNHLNRYMCTQSSTPIVDADCARGWGDSER